MKKFLFAFFICLAPFTAKADFLSELVDFASKQATSAIPRLFDTVDTSLRPYIDKEDYQTILDSGASLYYLGTLDIKNLLGYTAAYEPQGHNIFINPYVNETNNLNSKETKALMQGLIHHEVRHLKDFYVLKENNYNPQTIMTDLDKTSQMLFGAIIEARAYIEQAVFFYDKTKELAETEKKLGSLLKGIKQNGMPLPPSMDYNYLKSVADEASDLLNEDSKAITEENIDNLYNRIKGEHKNFSKALTHQGNPMASTFNIAIAETGNVKDAIREAMKSLLSGGFFKALYLDSYIYWPSGNLHISPEEFLKILGEDYFTLEDFYSAEYLWINVCNNKQTTASEDCRLFWNRYEVKHCPDIREKWLSCGRLKNVIDAEEKCKKCKNGSCSEHSQRKITTTEDEQALIDCCALKYFPFFH